VAQGIGPEFKPQYQKIVKSIRLQVYLSLGLNLN
jgi:hypothetical protein